MQNEGIYRLGLVLVWARTDMGPVPKIKPRLYRSKLNPLGSILDLGLPLMVLVLTNQNIEIILRPKLRLNFEI